VCTTEEFKYKESSKEFGEVEFENRTYALTQQAYSSCRTFPGSWHDANEEETYIDEWCAGAIDKDGNKYEVTWQWDMIKGDEPEDGSNYPWFDENIVSVELTVPIDN
jgi:hypothetical protein